MSVFCTKCGTANDGNAAFCDNCGAPIRAVLVSAPVSGQTAEASTPAINELPPAKTNPVNRKKVIYAAVGLAAVLMLGGAAMYFVLQSPAASAATLLAAAKKGYGKETTDSFLKELCISNINYSERMFNAGESDLRTQAWLNALVAAGLYKAPVAVSSGGFFSQTLLQYVATPELAKYRQGNALCAAKAVELADVIDIEKPQEQFFGNDGGPPKVVAVKSKLVWQSVDTAPWMDNPEVRSAVMANIGGWEYKDKVLQKRVDDYFGLKDNKWTTGEAYKQSLEKQYRVAQRGTSQSRNQVQGSSDAVKTDAGGWASKMSGLFTFGHPLKGTWQTAAQNTGFGVVPAGTGPSLTFTADSMEAAGQSTNVDFAVDGKRVKVTPKGQSQSLIFVMESPDTMVSEALGDMRYERVK